MNFRNRRRTNSKNPRSKSVWYKNVGDPNDKGKKSK